jgi:hypothetical protein
MSKPIKIEWKAFNPQAICLPQTLAAAGNLIINGDEAVLNSPISYFTYVNLERTVSITSTTNNDLSGIGFTVHGTLRGIPVSEGPVAGPTNNQTIELNDFFTTITSITADAPIPTGVSVGSGTEGHTIWLRSDYHRTVNNTTVGVKVLAGAITYTFETSLDDPLIVTTVPYIIAPVDGVTIPTIPAATDMIDATTSSAANYTWPTHSSRVRVSVSDAAGALNFYLLQQAIT